MTKFVFIYHDSEPPESVKDGAKLMARWQAWLGEIEATDPGAPFAHSNTLHAGGRITEDGGVNPASGYSIVEAGDPVAAIDLAKGCPIFEVGGSVEVCEVAPT